jgi:signal transduction histidine kinase
MAAHELRTPLSVITGYLSMLADGTLGSPGEPWLRPIDILNIKAAELNKLVDALLLAARMESGTIHGEPQVVELDRLAREALRRAEARAHLLDADMRIETPPEPVLVEADPSHVGRILDNLINNALTYSAERPWVKVTVSPEAEVSVEDRGLGVPEDRWEAIFERFYRVNDPSLPPQPGTGLGLYLSRELAQRYGGSVVLDRSTPGHGSRFLLRLSPAAVDAVAANAEPAVAVPAATAPMAGAGIKRSPRAPRQGR